MNAPPISPMQLLFPWLTGVGSLLLPSLAGFRSFLSPTPSPLSPCPINPPFCIPVSELAIFPHIIVPQPCSSRSSQECPNFYPPRYHTSWDCWALENAGILLLPGRSNAQSVNPENGERLCNAARCCRRPETPSLSSILTRQLLLFYLL